MGARIFYEEKNDEKSYAFKNLIFFFTMSEFIGIMKSTYVIMLAM